MLATREVYQWALISAHRQHCCNLQPTFFAWDLIDLISNFITPQLQMKGFSVVESAT